MRDVVPYLGCSTVLGILFCIRVTHLCDEA